MILDERNEFADAVSCNTGAAGTYNIGDQIPLGTAGDIGLSDNLWLVVTVATGITVASSTGTVAFQLASDASASIATDGSQSIHATSKAWATSTTAIAAGTVLFMVKLPAQGTVYEGYIGVQQVTGTTAINAGAVNAFLTPDVSKWTAIAAPWQ